MNKINICKNVIFLLSKNPNTQFNNKLTFFLNNSSKTLFENIDNNFKQIFSTYNINKNYYHEYYYLKYKIKYPRTCFKENIYFIINHNNKKYNFEEIKQLSEIVKNSSIYFVFLKESEYKFNRNLKDITIVEDMKFTKNNIIGNRYYDEYNNF